LLCAPEPGAIAAGLQALSARLRVASQASAKAAAGADWHDFAAALLAALQR